MELQDDDEYKTLVFSDSYIQISPDALQFEGELARRDVLKTLHLYFLQRIANLPGPKSTVEVVDGLGEVNNNDGSFNILNKVSCEKC